MAAMAAPTGNQFYSQDTVMSNDFSQMPRLPPTRSTSRIPSQTPSNLRIGALAAPQITNSIHKKLSRFWISARHQRHS